MKKNVFSRATSGTSWARSNSQERLDGATYLAGENVPSAGVGRIVPNPCTCAKVLGRLVNRHSRYGALLLLFDVPLQHIRCQVAQAASLQGCKPAELVEHLSWNSCTNAGHSVGASFVVTDKSVPDQRAQKKSPEGTDPPRAMCLAAAAKVSELPVFN